jgi:hypothetical protein
VFEGCDTGGEPVAIGSERAHLGYQPLNLGFTVQREQLDGGDGTNRQSAGAKAKSKRRLPVSDVLTNATIRSASATPEPRPPERAHACRSRHQPGRFQCHRCLLSTAITWLKTLAESGNARFCREYTQKPHRVPFTPGPASLGCAPKAACFVAKAKPEPL